jgi:hypothetical protein
MCALALAVCIVAGNSVAALPCGESGGSSGFVAMAEPPEPGEITAAKAADCCREFMKLCGIPVPNSAPTVRRNNPYWPGANARYVVTFEDRYQFYLDAKTGEIGLYSDLKRYGVPVEATPQDGKLLKDLLVAKSFLRSLAQKLGVPADWKMRYEGHSAEVVQTQQTMPEKLSVDFLLTVADHVFHDGHGGKCSLLVFTCDGAIASYARTPTWPYIIESRESKLTLRQARSLAAPIVKKFAVGVPKDAVIGAQTIPTKKHAELMYVRPNGSMGAPRYDPDERPFRVRLAWVLYYAQDEEVWIDAGDGKLLGGIQHDPGPKPKRQ